MIHPWHFCRLAADESTSRLATSLSYAFDHLGSDLDLESATSVIIEKEQRFCTLNEQVVDGHGHQIDTWKRLDRSGGK